MLGIIATAIIAVLLLMGHKSAEAKRQKTALSRYASGSPQLRSDILNKIIRIGMSEQEVIDSWGQPSRRTVRQLKTKVKTTLHFGTYQRVYLDNGLVTGWHTLAG